MNKKYYVYGRFLIANSMNKKPVKFAKYKKKWYY